MVVQPAGVRMNALAARLRVPAQPLHVTAV